MSFAAVTTTIRISKVPRRCTTERLVDALEKCDLLKAVDFVFIPCPSSYSRLRLNKGCAFINVPDPELAQDVLAGRVPLFLSGAKDGAELTFKPARSQGVRGNLQALRKETHDTALKCVTGPIMVVPDGGSGALTSMSLEAAVSAYGIA